MSRDHNTFEKHRRELEKKRKAEEKRVRRRKKSERVKPEGVCDQTEPGGEETR